MRMGG